MNHLNILKLVVIPLLLANSYLHANEKLISGSIKCSAAWNELCEDKKIISVPDNYRLCHQEISIAEQSGDASYQVVATDSTSITVYFRAKGNQDRLKQKGAAIKLNVGLFGVEKTDTCEESTAVAMPGSTEPEISITPAASIPDNSITNAATQENPHACACSQWLNWMKVEQCLSRPQRPDRPPCDSYEVTIQCVSSKDICRNIQKDNCPQVVGLNQSTSLKRLFIENSSYCQK